MKTKTKSRPPAHSEEPAFADWLLGGSETGELIRSMEWSATPLGSREKWPQSLRTVTNLILSSSFPIAILWSSDLIFIYNDAYRIIAADKHPNAMGRSTREVWPEVWEFNKPIFDRVMTQGETVHIEDQRFPIYRQGYVNDAYFTLSYSPICTEDNHVAGTMVVLLETTDRVFKSACKANLWSFFRNVQSIQLIGVASLLPPCVRANSSMPSRGVH